VCSGIVLAIYLGQFEVAFEGYSKSCPGSVLAVGHCVRYMSITEIKSHILCDDWCARVLAGSSILELALVSVEGFEHWTLEKGATDEVKSASLVLQ
jgi:hypothetical protein